MVRLVVCVWSVVGVVVFSGKYFRLDLYVGWMIGCVILIEEVGGI